MKIEKVISPVVMWFIIIAGVVLIFIFVGDKKIFASGVINKLILAMSFAFWLYFFISAFRVHKQVAKSAEKIEKIVGAGVYGIVRHPIYMADIVLAWGIFIAFPDLRFLTAVIYSTIIWFIWMKLEEKALIGKFGKEYLEYIRKVPMIIPKI
jgi:protein-S-isoprenylcysteine O-methyltransferase Ste14